MAIRAKLIAGMAASFLLLGGCDERRTGPIVISAIGGAPRLVNPNLQPIDPPSALLLQATAQGLVRFDASGQVEPALAQSWIVSDDGLRYTFRLARLPWTSGQPVTAPQVAARLRAAIGRTSRNPLKNQLGAIDTIEAMTDDVIEIALKGPRPNFLQLLAQPEMAVVQNDRGTGPYKAERQPDRSILLSAAPSDGEDEGDDLPPVVLRGERAALAIVRFAAGQADMVTGGTAGDLPIVRQADLPPTALRFEPVSGLFGLEFASRSGPLGRPEVRQALSMAVDRQSLIGDLAAPNLEPRVSLVPDGIDELPQPKAPDWVQLTPPQRQERAARAIAGATGDGPLTLRVAMPDQPGYRLVFAHLRRDWRAIGVEAQRVEEGEDADLRLVDAVAPISQAAWYLRRFGCAASLICLPEADDLLDAARAAQTAAGRQQALADADALLEGAAPFIPLTTPVRWTLVSQRLTGFQPNAFAQHFPGSLLARPY